MISVELNKKTVTDSLAARFKWALFSMEKLIVSSNFKSETMNIEREGYNFCNDVSEYSKEIYNFWKFAYSLATVSEA